MKRQYGFSLIELMVGMSIALFISILLVDIYANNNISFRAQQSISASQNSALFSMNFLQGELRSAGFNGCGVNPTGSNPNTKFYDDAVSGVRYDGSNLPAEIKSTNPGRDPVPIKGSDIISIWTVDGAAHTISAAMTDKAAIVPITDTTAFSKNDIALITNCSSSELFDVSAVNAGKGLSPAKPLSITYPINSQVYRVVHKTFYIAQSLVNPKVNSLYRICSPSCSDAAGTGALEFASGFSNDVDKNNKPRPVMIVTYYGIGETADPSVTSYVTSSQVTDWSKVAAIKIQALLVTSKDHIGAQKQTYHFNGADTQASDYRVYTPVETIVSLRNRLP